MYFCLFGMPLRNSKSLETPCLSMRACIAFIICIRYVTGNQTLIKTDADCRGETGKHQRAYSRKAGVVEVGCGGGGVFPLLVNYLKSC